MTALAPPVVSPTPRHQRLPRMNRREADDVRRLLAFVLAPDANAVDVGAHGGGVLREILRVAPAGRHLAVEPLPDLAVRLRELHPDVEVLDMALSDETGVADFVHVTTLRAWSGLRRRPYPGHVAETDLELLQVAVGRLDDVVTRRVDFIKIDVEGAELGVLRGARRTLLEHRPVVLFELGMAATIAYDWGPAAIHHYLTVDVEYRIFDLDGDGPYTGEELADSVEHHLHRNYVARP